MTEQTVFDYLIVGGGQVSDDAARGIRELDPQSSIGILSADVDAPYTRPALSKKLWTDPDFDESQVPLNTAEDTGADIRLNTVVTSLDRTAKQVQTRGGELFGYGKLLLATGSRPRRLDGPDDDRVIAFRSFADYRRLRALATPTARAVLVGGGYIGAELAAALATNGVNSVRIVFPDKQLGGSQFPAHLAERYETLFRDGGVELVGGHRAERVELAEDGGLAVVLDDGTKLDADVVVVGLGAEPVLDLARDAGLEVDGGVVVDEHLQTTDENIWAAGDIACYPDAILGRRRIEHVDNAREMGGAAGRSIAGSDQPYDHTPYFYSQVFGVRWEAVGTLDSELATVTADLSDDRKVVYYLDENSRPVGVLLWQVQDARDKAREVLAKAPTDRDELRNWIS